jgi:hypothetical protein
MMFMKKIMVLVLISGIIFSIGCKKDSKVADIINPSASMTCKINGVSWKAITRVTTKQGNSFLINGTGSLGSDVLNVTVFDTIVGTYNLTTTLPVQTKMSATFTNSTSSTDSLYTAYEGTVTLSSVDYINKKISGSFSFKAKNLLMNEKNFTSGTFSSLIYQ